MSSLKSRPRIHADTLLFWNISVWVSPAYRLSVVFCTRDSNEPRKRVFRTWSCDCMKRPKCILATASAFCTRIGAGGWFLVSCGVFDFARQSVHTLCGVFTNNLRYLRAVDQYRLSGNACFVRWTTVILTTCTDCVRRTVRLFGDNESCAKNRV